MVTAAAKRLALETLGWVVLALGILALFLPGPGLLLTFAGLVILSTQYAWARHLLEPVRVAALRAAVEGVRSWPRIVLSTLSALVLLAVSILWLLAPPAPPQWPLREEWWLFGGAGVGVTLVVSALIALGLLGYSVRRFHSKPAAVAEVAAIEARYFARRHLRRRARKRLSKMHPTHRPAGARRRGGATGTDRVPRG